MYRPKAENVGARLGAVETETMLGALNHPTIHKTVP